MKIPLLLFSLALAGCATALDDITRSANAVEAIASPASRALDTAYEAKQRACLAVTVVELKHTCVEGVRATFAEALDARAMLALASSNLADTVNKLKAQGSEPTAAELLTLAEGVDALVIAEGRFITAKKNAGVK